MYHNKPISASDPQAVEKLTAKMEQCEKMQETMKAVNSHRRKTGTCVGAPGITEAQAVKMDKRIEAAQYPWDKTPYSDYSLKNNYAEIKRLKTRIETLNHNKEVGFSGWDFSGGHAEANTELNRLQLFFDEKPDDGQRAMLKSNGFKWAPSQGAWQRQLNDNALYAANRLPFLKPSDGRAIREHQPKAPVKDGGAR